MIFKDKQILAAIFIFCWHFYGLGNTMWESNTTTPAEERVYVHYNKGLLFAGESLKYKLYCFDQSTRNLSEISKIAYVMLIDKTGAKVFEHKLVLQSGQGNSDFFIPVSVATGSYKLLAFTKWMMNFGAENYFQSDIHIINPYQTVPRDYLVDETDSTATDTKKNIPHNQKAGTVSQPKSHIIVSLDKSPVDSRSKFTLNILPKSESSKNGSYSVWVVRKSDLALKPETQDISEFHAELAQYSAKKESLDKIHYLPEMRGELISGHVRFLDDSVSTLCKKVSLSLPGQDFLFKIASVDQKGRFNFTVDRRYENITAIIQVLDHQPEDYKITLDDIKIDLKNIKFSDFAISQDLEQKIIDRSIQNQIESSYTNIRADSILPVLHDVPFYRKLDYVFNLDDYTRFKSVAETMVEIVDNVYVTSLDDERQVFKVRLPLGDQDIGLLPLVFLDGAHIQNHEDVLSLKAKRIKSISFSRNRYLLGSKIYQGIISFYTFSGENLDTNSTENSKSIKLKTPQRDRVYFKQSYGPEEKERYERLPDYRRDLLWHPNLKLDGPTNIDVYSSDVSGTYEIIVEGFTENGFPIREVTTLEVN